MSKSELLKLHDYLKSKEIKSRLHEYSDNLFLKLECELPGGSYKIRGVENFFLKNDFVKPGFKVLSAGNLALACAICSKKYGISCTAVVPDNVSDVKEIKLKKVGAEICKLPYSKIWEQAKNQDLLDQKNYLHPLADELIMGYGTIALELMSSLDNLDAIVIPYGLGGLALGITEAIEHLGLSTEVWLAEIQGHSPFKDALDRIKKKNSIQYSGFIEAMGTPEVISNVFDKLKSRISGILLVSEGEVKNAIKELYCRQGITVEGAAGAAFAAAKNMKIDTSKTVVSILTGANISKDIHREILND